MKYLLLLFILPAFTTSTFSQEIIPLYPEGVKNSQPSDEKEKYDYNDILWISQIQNPTLEIYLPVKQSRNGKAVVICPGGGYYGLAYDWEGTEIAKWFNSKGIAAFVLKYRMPNSKSVEVGRLAPLQDAQRAMRIVRSRATEWNINSDEIGVMGFSAGGHLASTLGTHYEFEDERFFDASTIDTVSARPNFMVLMYPVITMNESFTHAGSRESLLGQHPTQNFVDFYSNELQVTDQTPPTFIVHSSDDDVVPVQNAISMYNALVKKNIFTEMHIYPFGGHGYSLGLGQKQVNTWPDLLSKWLESLPE